MRHAVPIAASFVLAAVLVSPASARIWEKSWTVPERPTVHVHTNDARVHVVRGATGSVHTRIEYKVRVWGWHSEPKDPLLELKQQGNDISITARERGNVVVFGGISEEFRIEVTVPDDCDLDLHSGDGSIEVEPGSGALTARSGDGHITATGFHGSADLFTRDGGISAEDFDGSLSATTGDGSMRVSGRFDRLALHTGDGGVRATVQKGSKLEQPWELTTGDGSVALLIPRDLSARIDASTGDGSIHVDLPVDVSGGLSRHALRGELNGGRTPLTMRTRDGSITLGVSH